MDDDNMSIDDEEDDVVEDGEKPENMKTQKNKKTKKNKTQKNENEKKMLCLCTRVYTCLDIFFAVFRCVSLDLSIVLPVAAAAGVFLITKTCFRGWRLAAGAFFLKKRLKFCLGPFFQNLRDQDQDNIDFAGPTEKLPTGLKHIREDTTKKEKNKDKIEKA